MTDHVYLFQGEEKYIENKIKTLEISSIAWQLDKKSNSTFPSPIFEKKLIGWCPVIWILSPQS